MLAGITRAAPAGAPLYVASSISDGGGKNHTCAVISRGRVVCWGDDTDGELGNGKHGVGKGLFSAVPVPVKGLSGATAVGASKGATCAVISGGSVKCWGSDGDGELGDGRSGQNLLSTTPVRVSGVSRAVSVSGGNGGMCAVISGGTLKCWGYNGTGGIGAGRSVSGVTTPVSVPVSGVKQVSLSGFNTGCAVTSGGTVSCWGSDVYGELGNGTVSAFPSFDPVTVSRINNATAVSAGWGFACAALETGSIDCWGLGAQGQLGRGKVSGVPVTTPVAVKGISNATTVSAGIGFACAVLRTGWVDCWGLGGDLGNGTMADSAAPIRVKNVSGAKEVSADDQHACALLRSGAVKCWGANAFPNLGRGGITPRAALTPGYVHGFGPTSATTHKKSTPTASGSNSARQTVLGLEGILAKMASERAILRRAITQVAACSTAPGAAAAQVTAVGAARRLLISQVRALAAPTVQATKLRVLLLSALADSAQSDRHYSDWLAQQGSRCPPKPNANLLLAQRSDKRATAAKQQFLARFNPLARKLHLRTWSAKTI